MFTPVVRSILIFGCLAIGVWWLSIGKWTGILLLFAAACLGFGYFRYSTVWLAFRALRKGNNDASGGLTMHTADSPLRGLQLIQTLEVS